MAPLIPKSMANQTITLKKYLGTDPNDIYNDSPLYETSTIENCVFQPQTIYTGTNNNREVVANAIVYLYAGCFNSLFQRSQKLITARRLNSRETSTAYRLLSTIAIHLAMRFCHTNWRCCDEY
jgi:hypothetical protein